MFNGYDWNADVLPVIADFLGSDLVKGGVITILALTVAVYVGRGLLGIFWKRE